MKKKYNVLDKTSLKCVLVGDCGVGKSNVAARLSSRTFKSDYSPTLFDNFAATVTVDEKPYHISMFDTAGQEDFDRLRILAYMNCDVFLICFSVTNHESLRHVEETWVPELRQYLPKTPFIVVGTQTDLRDEVSSDSKQILKQSMVSAKEGAEMASRVGAASYTECSAKTGDGMDDVTREMIYAVVKCQDTCTKSTKCCAPCTII